MDVKVLATFQQFPTVKRENSKLSPLPTPLAGHNPCHNSCHKSAMKCVVLRQTNLGNTRIIALELCLRAAAFPALSLFFLLLLLPLDFGIDWALDLACCGGSRAGERESERMCGEATTICLLRIYVGSGQMGRLRWPRKCSYYGQEAARVANWSCLLL